MLKKLINTLLVLSILTINAQQNEIEKHIAASEELNNSLVSFYVEDINTGKVLVDINSDINIRPASNLKILTTYAALEILKPDTRFKTDIKCYGKINSGIINSSIIISTEGDPSINSKYFDKNEVDFFGKAIKTFKEKHIKVINGDIIVIDTLFKGLKIPATWLWGDIGNYYGAGVSSFGVFDNRYHIVFDTRASLNDTAKIKTIFPQTGIKLTNKVLIDDKRGDRTNIYNTELCNKAVIRGFLPQGVDSFDVKGSIQNPEKLLAEILKRKLEENGIVVNGKCKVIRNPANVPQFADKILFEYLSPTVAEIVEKTNLYSVNLFAEFLFRKTASVLNGDGSNSIAAIKLKMYWVRKGLNINNVNIFDGSGLSPYNLISTKNMATALKVILFDNKLFPVFKKSLPVAGKSGTLWNMFRKTEFENRLFAKSGSMTGVKTYSGYIYPEGKTKPLVFSIAVNNFTSPSYKIKKQIQQLILYLSKTYMQTQ